MTESTQPSGKSGLKSLLALIGAGGGLGLAALGGTCAAGCSLAGGAVIAFFSSIGLGALSTVLPSLRIPFLILAAALGGYALWSSIRQRDAVRSALVACVLGGGAALIAWQAFTPSTCHVAQGMSGMMTRLTPVSRRVVQEGIYALWPKLGRAPTVEETRQAMGFTNDGPVLSALNELEKLSDSLLEYPGTHKIRWLWPFSSEEHGVTVVLGDSKPVHARCAIDALGMSAMFGMRALITVSTPLDHKALTFLVDGKQMLRADESALVSYRPNDCDSMLFFSSRDELARYESLHRGKQLTVFPLSQALRFGISSFEEVFRS